MTMARARVTLVALFLASLIIQLVAFFLVRSRMWPEEFPVLIQKIFSIYSVPLAVVLGGMIAKRHDAPAAAPVSLAWITIVLTALWNLVLMGRSLAFALAEQDSVTSAASDLGMFAAFSSFLVAGVISAFFAAPSDRWRP